MALLPYLALNSPPLNRENRPNIKAMTVAPKTIRRPKKRKDLAIRNFITHFGVKNAYFMRKSVNKKVNKIQWLVENSLILGNIITFFAHFCCENLLIFLSGVIK